MNRQPEPIPPALDQLMRRAKRVPLLTAAEEIELAQRIERGDLEAKQRMIEANVRLVVSQAWRYQGHGLALEDLVQEGMLGLIRAVEKFDHCRGHKFSTYGVLWIRQAIQRGLQHHGRPIRIPRNVAQRQVKLRKAERELSASLGREPTDEEISDAAGISLDEVVVLRELGLAMASLDQRLGEAVERLPAEEQNVIRLRFGLAGEEPRTLRQAASELGITAARARELEQRGLRLLTSDGALEGLAHAAVNGQRTTSQQNPQAVLTPAFPR